MNTQQDITSDKSTKSHIKTSPQPQKFAVITMMTFVAFSQMAYGLLIYGGQEPSGGFRLLSYLILFSMMGFWLEKDSRQYNVDWVFDMGFFLYVAWPLIVPIYLFKTRGLRAFVNILGFLGLYLGAYLFGGVLGLLFLPE